MLREHGETPTLFHKLTDLGLTAAQKRQTGK